MSNRNEVMSKFFQENYNNLCKKVARRAGTPEGAEDVVQDAFYNALRSWDRFVGEYKDIGPWFGIILENSLKDYKQSERRLGTDLYLDDVEIGGEEMPESEENVLKHVQTYMESKQEGTRKILDLYFNKGYRAKEVADILNIHKRNVERAVDRFKQHLKENLVE